MIFKTSKPASGLGDDMEPSTSWWLNLRGDGETAASGKMPAVPESLARKPCENAGETAIEPWLEDLDAGKVATRDKPQTACQLIDKALLLRGQANARLGFRQGQPTLASVNARLTHRHRRASCFGRAAGFSSGALPKSRTRFTLSTHHSCNRPSSRSTASNDEQWC